MSIGRRSFLRQMASGAFVAVVAGCSDNQPSTRATSAGDAGHSGMHDHSVRLPEGAVLPDDVAVLAAEQRRIATGAITTRHTLVAQTGSVDIGGRVITTATFGGTLPGTTLRGSTGDLVAIALENRLDEPTAIHWHGLSVRNDMDGVLGVTQPGIAPGETFDYTFALPSPGTHWYHSHAGLQLDRGLYAPFIIDDPDDSTDYDLEHIIVLDDWIDGFGATPNELFDELRCQPTCENDKWLGKFSSDLLGGDAGSINYPAYLLNGRMHTDPDSITAAPGTRVRLRIINAAAETVFHFAVNGHALLVTHTDGNAIEPVEADSLVLSVGERFDAIITVGSGVFPIVAIAEGKQAVAAGVLRSSDTSPDATPAPTVPQRLPEHDRRLADIRTMRTRRGTPFDFGSADLTYDVTLSGGNGNYQWRLNGETYGDNGSLTVHEGQRVRLNIVNTSNIWHPMHLHGHAYRVGTKPDSVIKDTLLVKAGETHTIDVICNNPGQWMLHCHNAYHFEAGMAIPFSYLD